MLGVIMKKINVSFGIDKLFSYSRNDLIITSTLILPHQGGGKFFRELDAPQLCSGVRF